MFTRGFKGTLFSDNPWAVSNDINQSLLCGSNIDMKLPGLVNIQKAMENGHRNS